MPAATCLPLLGIAGADKPPLAPKRSFATQGSIDIAQDLYATADRLSVVRTPLGMIGMNICADNFPDSLSIGHVIARTGAQVLLSPSAWAVTADHDPADEPYGGLWKESYTTLAKLYEMPVVGVSNVGRLTARPWKGRKCIGCSLAVGGKAITAPAAVRDGRIYSGCEDGYLYALGPGGKARLPSRDLRLSKIHSPPGGKLSDPKHDWVQQLWQPGQHECQ